MPTPRARPQPPHTGRAAGRTVPIPAPAALAVCLLVHGTSPLLAQPAGTAPLPVHEEHVEVVGVTPIHGTGLPIFKVPANVQVITAAAIDGLPASDVPALLERRGAGIHLSDAQGGAFQPDVLFRGFTASPLLGASEGLAVYQDGVRMNDPFGDTMHWDVLPAGAIASVNVIPGSNPLFGLNAVGGALSIQTRTGFGWPGHRAKLSAGGFGRRLAEAESGGHGRSVAYYLAGTLLDEGGWRDFSPSTIRRLFADLSWRGAVHAASLSLTAASNDLTGNGAAPLALLDTDRRAVFTHPDRTANDLAVLSARGRRHLSPATAVEAVAYYRDGRIGTFNGDLDDDDDGDDEVADDDLDEAGLAGVNHVSRTRSRAAGATAQVRRTADLAGRPHHFVAGTTFDAARTRFDFEAEEATLTPDRGTRGTGTWIEAARVDLHSDAVTAAAFVTSTWSATPALALTVSARFNATRVSLRDQIGTALSGDHRFRRLNPAAGLTWQAGPLNVYGGYAESSRVPTPVELTCADPEDPCRLPNAFVSDPPLRQVVGRTWEAGIRGAAPLRWTMAFFDTVSADDILFVSSGTLRGEGHFENVARTRRRGLEASVQTGAVDRRLTASAAYTFQLASFGTDLVVASRAHPLARGGEIQVGRGDRLPNVPAHVARFAVEARALERLRVAVHGRAQSAQVMRGDEAGLLAPVPGFAVIDADLRLRLSNAATGLVHVRNLSNARFHTFGIVGDASPLVAGAGPRFYSPGAPRAAWGGLELRF